MTFAALTLPGILDSLRSEPLNHASLPILPLPSLDRSAYEGPHMHVHTRTLHHHISDGGPSELGQQLSAVNTQGYIWPSVCHCSTSISAFPPPPMRSTTGWNFARSRERTTAPSSSPPCSPASTIQACVPLLGSRTLSVDDLAAVYPLLLLGRGSAHSERPLERVKRRSRGARRTRSARRTHRKAKSTRTAEVARAAEPHTQPSEQSESDTSLFSSYAPGDTSLMSSPPADPDVELAAPIEGYPSHIPRVAIAHEDAPVRLPVVQEATRDAPSALESYESRPNSNSSLPTPPLSPRIEAAVVSRPPRQAMIMVKAQRHCIACGTVQSPCWRPSWDASEGKLCNSCGLRFRKSRARCVSPTCLRIPARSELSEARIRAAGRPVCCLKCNNPLVFVPQM